MIKEAGNDPLKTFTVFRTVGYMLKPQMPTVLFLFSNFVVLVSTLAKCQSSNDTQRQKWGGVHWHQNKEVF